MSKQAFKRVRRTLRMTVNRNPLPNHEEGYPIFFITSDCSALCAECINEEIERVDDEQRKPDRHDQFRVVSYEANWENTSLYCDHCSKPIPSAYGDDEHEEPENEETMPACPICGDEAQGIAGAEQDYKEEHGDEATLGPCLVPGSDYGCADCGVHFGGAEQEEPVNIEQCPGCGCLPGDGPTEGCTHENGCGSTRQNEFWGISGDGAKVPDNQP